MKTTTRKSILIVVFAMLALSPLSANFSLSGFTGFGRLFEMAFSGVGSRGGIVVDGVKAGLDALVEIDDENTVSLQANAIAAANSGTSVMTFNASLHKEADISDEMTLFVKTGIETHLILHTGVSTEVGIACTGGASYEVKDGMNIVVSAGLNDMFFSTAVSTIYGSARGSVNTVGMNASVECRYSF